MLQSGSLISVIDNSGLKKSRCIRISTKSSKQAITIGDFFIGSVLNKTLRLNYKSKCMLFLCVGCRKPYRHLKGVYIKFNVNKCVTFLNKETPGASKVLGPSLQDSYKNIKNFNTTKLNSLVEYSI